MQHTKTGIRGLDEPLGNGIPKGSLVLLTGSPGTGKTILGLEYLYNGARSYNEKGLMISFEENEEDILQQASQFGWDLAELQNKKQLIIWCLPANKIDKDTLSALMRIIKHQKIERVVIDSVSTLAFNTPTITNVQNVNDIAIKRFMYDFLNRLRSTGVTGLIISHNRDNDMGSIDGVSEFICDGIVHIKFQPMGGNYSRSLSIQKMRNAKNDEDLHPLEITSKGIVVHNLE